MVIGLGGRGAEVVGRLGEIHYGSLVMDTDQRTMESLKGTRRVLLGSGMLSGEGCGGNMNLGRKVISGYLKRIPGMISGAHPLINVFGAGGGTGIPFAVELSGICRELSIPYLNFCLKSSDPGNSENKIASILLSGPLRPGCMVEAAGGSEKNDEPDETVKALDIIARCFAPDARIPLPSSILDKIREDAPLIELDSFTLSGEQPADPGKDVLLSALSLPGTQSNSETEEMIRGLGLEENDTPLGITISEDKGNEPMVVVLRRDQGGEALHIGNGGPHINADYIKALESEGFGIDPEGAMDLGKDL